MEPRKSEWLITRTEPDLLPECGACGGTGSAGTNAKGETITCKKCRGFGY